MDELTKAALQALRSARGGPSPGEGLRTQSIVDDVRTRLFGQPSGVAKAAKVPTLNRYELGSMISYGGMGIVHRAWDPLLQRKVAIKLRRPDRPESESDYARLMNEARALSALHHPNVVAVFDAGRIDGRNLYVVLELVEGVTLAQWRTPRRTWQEVIELMTQVGRGLAAAHASTPALIHRDVKPSNILVAAGKDGVDTAKLIDFGLVKVFDGQSTPIAEPGGPGLYSVTEHEHIVGTRGYIAPELFEGGAPSAQSDIFSLGVTLYWALFQRSPFARSPDRRSSRLSTEAGQVGEGTPESVSQRIGQYVEPGRRERDVPTYIKNTLRRALALEPRQRYPTMTALLEDLAAKPRRRRMGIIGVSLAAGAVAVVPQFIDSAEYTSPGLEQYWNDRSEAVHEQLRATGHPRAESTFEVLRQRFPRYAQAWEAEHRRFWDAERAEQSLPWQGECLNRAGDDYMRTIEGLATIRPTSVDKMADLVAGLKEPGECANLVVAAQACHAPVAGADADNIANVRTQISAAYAAHVRGDLEGAVARARQAAELAGRLGWHGLRAEAQLAFGDLLYLSGRYTEALVELDAGRRAAWAVMDPAGVDSAPTSGCADVLADSLRLLNKIGLLEGLVPPAVLADRIDEQESLGRVLGGRTRFMADALNERALFALNMSHDYRAAVTTLAESIAIREPLARGSDVAKLALADSYLNLASAYQKLGDAEGAKKAEDALLTAETYHTEVVGAAHPSRYKLEFMRGNLEFAAKRYEQARRHLDPALALAHEYGADSLEVVRIEMALSRLWSVWKQPDVPPTAAEEHALRAVEIAAGRSEVGFGLFGAKMALAQRYNAKDEGALAAKAVELLDPGFLAAFSSFPVRQGEIHTRLAESYGLLGEPRQQGDHAAMALARFAEVPKYSNDVPVALLNMAEAIVDFSADDDKFRVSEGPGKKCRAYLDRIVAMAAPTGNGPTKAVSDEILAEVYLRLAQLDCAVPGTPGGENAIRARELSQDPERADTLQEWLTARRCTSHNP